MKKITLFVSIVAACASSALLAQPTITSADFPTLTSKWAELSDNRAGMHAVTAGGANLNWDYSTGYYVIDDTSFTSFMTPASVPNGWGSNFPTADLAQYSAVDSMAQFFELNTTGIYFDGMYSGTKYGFGKMDYTPDMYFLPTPFTYNSTKSNTSRIVALTKYGTYNAKFILRVTQNLTADAYGTLKTPAGTYSNTLRVHTFSYSYDSIFVDFTGSGTYSLLSGEGPKDTSDTYSWYSAAQKAPVASADFEGPASKSASVSATYYDFTLLPSSVKELNAAKALNVYPNPAVNQPVYFSFDANSTVTNIVIYNASGQLVRTEQIAGANQLLLQTNDMNAGIYFYSLNDKNGKQTQTGKFIVGK
ncbi:MAG: T9SS type A sorting domain-containing protein [Bacteroidetes bacterium]|nr:T9SS type A sorting domain-containing protein [Bacteroidota bacterium]